MIRLRGTPFGPGVALGSVGILRAPNGIPLLPAAMVAQMSRASDSTPIEPFEVVLVAEEYEAAASLVLPWAHVVGIAAERWSDRALRSGIPAVVGVHGLLSSVEDDALILIDGDRGVVLIDPDGTALADYQAERERIAPRRRLYLDFAHQTARTQDGREIHVLARVESLHDVRTAIEQGADALYVPMNSSLLPADASDDVQLEHLLQLSEAAAGKPITLAGDVESIAVTALMRASRRAEFTLAFPLSFGLSGFEELQNGLREIREMLLMEEINFADFQLAGFVPSGEVLDNLDGYLISRLVVETAVDGEPFAEERAWLAGLTAAAARLLLPVEVIHSAPNMSALETALGLGASGFIVAPEVVQWVKQQVRDLDTGACRAALHNGSDEGVKG